MRKTLRFFVFVLWLGSIGSFVGAEGSVEPMSAVQVSGLPPYLVQEQVVRSAWTQEDLLRLTTFAPSGESAHVEIGGIGKREFPPEPIATLSSSSIERTSGIRRLIKFFDSENRLLAEVGLNQPGGARILDTFSVSAGAARGQSLDSNNELVDVVLTRLNAPSSRIPIKVAPGRSIVFNVGGVRWIFTCRGASAAPTSGEADAALSFDYTLFRE